MMGLDHQGYYYNLQLLLFFLEYLNWISTGDNSLVEKFL